MGKVETAPSRWIETHAPQFPAQHASRNCASWERIRLHMKAKHG